jgi:transcriptional regulator with XRE-family HTH domain
MSAAKKNYQPARRRAHLTPGQMLKTVRKLQEMSQKQLADASGVEQPTISGMENGRVELGLERAKRLARALHVHPGVLVFADWEDEDRHPSEASEERDVQSATKKPAHRQTRVAS